jgi:outer membrane protein TolC
MSRRLLFVSVLCAALRAQTVPPQAVPPTDRPLQLPLSGRGAQPGTVVTVQNPLPSGLQSINTITSNVQVQGAYSGSVPSTQTAGPPLALSLDEAVRRGLQYNLGTIVNQQGVRVAEAGRTRERAALLPYVASNLLINEQQINLAALGFSGFPGIPQIVGPFRYFDLRAGATQSVIDLTRIRNYRGAQENVRSAQLGAQDARDLIVLAVTGAYLQILAAGSRVETTRAQVATAHATYQQAFDRQAAGVAPRIDVTRTQVILQVNQQRQIALENDLAKLKIAFARLIGLPPAQDVNLIDALPFAPLAGITLDQALTRALANRADLKAAESQVHAAELARGAASAERYPTIQVSGDYGVIGPSPTNSHGTFGATAAVRLPLFQGGRVQADIDQADAALQQRRAELQDLRGRIDAEVRSAFLDLTSAANQIRVAESNRRLAAETLTQARDRFAAGVADTLEVVQAEESVAVAEQDYISSLYAHNLAKATIARAMGQADQNIRQFLGRP